jgi:hypothetical protein
MFFLLLISIARHWKNLQINLTVRRRKIVRAYTKITI